MKEYFKAGAKITTAPKPLMSDELYDPVRLYKNILLYLQKILLQKKFSKILSTRSNVFHDVSDKIP